jgi:DNA-binding NtrC family response regulator
VRKKWPNTIRMILSGQADLEAAVRAINEGEVYRFLLKPCHPKELQLTILQGLQHKKLVAQSRKLLQEHQKTMNLIEALEKDNPGITKIELDEDGAIMMDEGEPGALEDVQSLLDDLEREMSKIGTR